MNEFDYQKPELLEVSYKSIVSGESCRDFMSGIDNMGCSAEEENPEYE